MVLREQYADYFIKSSKLNTYANYAYSTVCKYDEEDVSKYVGRYELALQEYVRHDVKKYFGINIEQYLNLTYRQKDSMLKVCVEEAKRALEAAEAVKKDSNAELNKIKNSVNSKTIKPTAQPTANLSGFDFNELYGDE